MVYFIDAYSDARHCWYVEIGDGHETARDLLEAWCRFDRFVESGKYAVVTLWEAWTGNHLKVWERE